MTDEPVEVAADELAAAEHWLREGLIIGNGERMRDVLMAEYDRRSARITKLEGMVCTCHQGQAMEAQLDRLTAELHTRNVDAKSATIQAVGLRAELTELRKNSIPLNYALGAEQEIRVEFDDE